MSDDNMRSPAGNRLTLTEGDEVRYWTNVLGISQSKLEAEIKKHGDSAWLRKYRPPRASEAEPGLPRTRPSAIAGHEIGFDPPAATNGGAKVRAGARLYRRPARSASRARFS
jgi:Protein of unknown function (DUF3606)